ncbi:MAG: site-specific integrase [Chitinophagaceae bacterium]
MNKSFGILFYVRKAKLLENGTAPVYVRVTVDSGRFEFATKCRIEPKKWNSIAQKANGTNEEARSINAYLKTIEMQVYNAHRELMEEATPLTAQNLKKKLFGNEKEIISLVDVFKNHNQQLAALVEKEYAPATVKRYDTALRHVRNFLKWKYDVEDIDIKEIDHSFITAFDFYLRSVRNCNNNSTFKYVKNFKKIIGICLANGWLTNNPFIKYKIKIKEVARVVLTEEELESLWLKTFTNTRLEVTRDVFIFCCFTGLAYIDVKKLRRSMICSGIDGEKWIFTSRQKSKEPSRVPLLPTAVEILEKYKDDAICIHKDLALPVNSNQKMNAYLKEIADVCGIQKDLTSHIARHTFATTVTLSNGVPIESVSKMLGHRSLRTTQHYAKILDRKVSEDMKILKEKLSSKKQEDGKSSKQNKTQ